MDGIKEQNHTPLRKMSLRRKRCNKLEERSESPLHKKSSPPILRNNMKKEDQSISSSLGQNGQEKLSQVYCSRRASTLQDVSPCEPPCTPKNQRTTRRSRTKSTEKKTRETMRSSILEEQRQNQHSPDTPFISSQLCGTQECEVVWDCNSPGFSKDDLKRMSCIGENEQMQSPAIFVAPLPSRTLFPKLRPRLSSSVSAVNTTAQLDELFNQVAKNGGLLSGSKSEALAVDSDLPEVSKSSLITQKCLLAPSPPVDSSSVSSSLSIPELISKQSSQPFMVREGKDTASFDSETEAAQLGNNLSDHDELSDDIWEEDLNQAICNVSVENEFPNVPSEDDNETSTCKLDTDLVGKISRKDKSCNSTDMFDDDYFNDSLIQSTQLWEKEILEKDTENPRFSTDKGKVLMKALELDSLLNQNGNNGFTNRISPKLHKEVSVSHKNVSEKPLALKSSVVTSVGPNNSESNKTEFTLKSSPVIGKPLSSCADNPPKRRLRNTFRLDGSLAINSAAPETTKNTAIRMNDSTQSDVNNLYLSSGNLTASKRISDTVTSGARNFSKQKPQCLTKTHVSELPMPLKTDTSFDGGVQPCKLTVTPLEPPTGVAGNAKSSHISKPPKSEKKDDPCDFEEEDLFFESLLCTIPEEDKLINKLKALDKCQSTDAKTQTTGVKPQTTEKGNVQARSRVTKLSISAEDRRKIQKHVINTDAEGTTVSPDLNQTITKGRSSSTSSSDNYMNKESENTFVNNVSSLQVKSASAGTSGSVRSSSRSSGMTSKVSTEDILDDDLFEDDVLSLIDEVESQFGSQPLQSQPLQLSQSPKSKCTLDEIARKREEAQRRREENIMMGDMRNKTKWQSKRKQDNNGNNFLRMGEELMNKRENAKNVEEFTERKGAEKQTIELLNTTKQKIEGNENITIKKEVAECRRRSSVMRLEQVNKGIGKTEENLKVDVKRKEEAMKKEETQKEQIARKKEEAIRRREERLKSRLQTSFNPSVR